jgi:hypothetical protein
MVLAVLVVETLALVAVAATVVSGQNHQRSTLG